VFSFAVAILVAARSISKKLAFQIFVGTTSLSHHLRAPFNSGLHAAFYSCMGFMAVAAVLSATRIASRRRSSAEAAVEAVPEEVRAGAS
jgi:hypothetical protein